MYKNMKLIFLFLALSLKINTLAALYPPMFIFMTLYPCFITTYYCNGKQKSPFQDIFIFKVHYLSIIGYSTQY